MKERQLILRASPCETNIYADGPETIEEVKKLGKCLCPNHAVCSRGFSTLRIDGCIMQMATKVAQYVLKGGTLDGEMLDFSREFDFGNGMFWSPDRKTFETIADKGSAVEKVRSFAKSLIDQTERTSAKSSRTNSGSFTSLASSATTKEGSIDLRVIEAAEGRFAHLPGRSFRCDVSRGPCACGAWH